MRLHPREHETESGALIEQQTTESERNKLGID